MRYCSHRLRMKSRVGGGLEKEKDASKRKISRKGIEDRKRIDTFVNSIPKSCHHSL